MKKSLSAILMIIAISITACSQQQARMPVSQSSGTFMKESVVRNKKLVAAEEKKIDSIIKSDKSRKFLASKKGYWYAYETKNDRDTLRPKRGDIAYFDYEVNDLDGNVIYTELELRPQEYLVDKEQNMIRGLRDGIKLMRRNEKMVFLFPSHMGYGYHGDNRRIGHNQALKYTVTLRDFKKDSDADKTISTD